MEITKHSEVKLKTSDLKEMLNKYLSKRLLRTWPEDFIDEDTGNVTTVERNEPLFERGTFIDQDVLSQIKFFMDAGDIEEVEVSNQLRLAYEVTNGHSYPFEAQAMIGHKKFKFLLHALSVEMALAIVKDYIELNYTDPFWPILVKQFNPCVILTDTLGELNQEEYEEDEESEEKRDKDKKYYEIETKISCENKDDRWETTQLFVVHTFDTNRAMLIINAYLQDQEEVARERALKNNTPYRKTIHTPILETAKSISVNCYIPKEFSEVYTNSINN